MTLIYCPECKDILRIVKIELRSCYCGKSSGRFNCSGNSIVIFGEALPIRISVSSFSKALAYRDEKGGEKRFNAYVASRDYKKITSKSNDK
jgi:hypothetical protein